jgi:electron transfer flavoprotein alpha subunit
MMVYTVHPLSDNAKEIISYGGDQVLEDLPKELVEQTDSLAKIIEQKRPEIVLFPSSSEMIPLAARVAQRFKTGLATDCVALNLDLTERRRKAPGRALLADAAASNRRNHTGRLPGGIFRSISGRNGGKGSVKGSSNVKAQMSNKSSNVKVQMSKIKVQIRAKIRDHFWHLDFEL